MHVRQLCTYLDRNGDGTIDVAELVGMLEGVTRTRRERRYLAYTVVIMFVFGLIMIGTIIGLTYAMLYSLKDTEVRVSTYMRPG
ncbi:hypothetical protein GPECTOR_27g641 [Gonium pectorale]|uniref:EF-hand domain-containing protein n=1 Tax=Gonium pectorale TaxID=33097 RepID=A0A150GF36_GONPE|nr:hypothetical protein GPECTOR_27g641 [Gonium pectorale]|eukprot:KXZ48471.1 hypothetical protein GPECTOR_27g641 [Gonium pectorale]